MRDLSASIVLHFGIHVALAVDTEKFPVVNGVDVLCQFGIAVNSNDFGVVKGMVAAFHLSYDFTLIGYGSPLDDRRFYDFGGSSSEPYFGEFVSLATGLDAAQPGRLPPTDTISIASPFLALYFYSWLIDPYFHNGSIMQAQSNGGQEC